MTSLSTYIENEQHLINTLPLDETTKKVGQIYCYLTSGPVMMLKIGKGKNGRQRMATWLQEYPPTWRDGKVIFVSDRVNQSTSETALHKLFNTQRVSADDMRKHLGKSAWETLPDGASEWFYIDKNVVSEFQSVGIDLVESYREVSGLVNLSEDLANDYVSNVQYKEYTEDSINRILENLKPMSRWDTGSDCRELVEYVNALLSYKALSINKGETDYHISSCNLIEGSSTIFVSDNCGNNISHIYVSANSEGGYQLLTSDLYTQLPLSYHRNREKHERRNSASLRQDFAKVLVNTLCQAIKSHQNPPKIELEVPIHHQINYPNGRRWSPSTHHTLLENYKSPLGQFLKKLRSKVKYEVHYKLEKDFPLGDLEISLEDSSIAGHYCVLIKFGVYKSFKYHVSAVGLNADESVNEIMSDSAMNFETLHKELSPRFTSDQVRKANADRSQSNVLAFIFMIAVVIVPIGIISSFTNSSSSNSNVENVR